MSIHWPITIFARARAAAVTALAALSLAAPLSSAQAGPTLASVHERGHVLCSTAGMLNTPREYDQPGSIAGFDRDFCRAVAAATLGDKAKVQYVHLVPNTRFEALQQGAVDVLIRSTTWTLERDAALGVHFAAVNFYDGQGFIAHKALGIRRLQDLKDQNKKSSVCVESGTTTLSNVEDLVRDKQLPLEIMAFNASEELSYALSNRRCDIYSSDLSFLVEYRLSNTLAPDDYVILDDVVSKEPLSAAVRDDDPEWFNIVRWVVFATIQAEELGITSANAQALRASGTVEQRRFLGGEPGIGKALKLDDDWALRVITQVGNYAEIFERNMGGQSVYKLARGLNRLWTDGGLMYSPPFR